jgi:protein-S-isoprenylcysteine O-methyltransferase Ste14
MHIVYGYLFFTLAPVTVGPVLIKAVGSAIDRWLDPGSLVPENVSLVLGILCFAFGIPWLVWAAVLDWTKGSGTPLPWFPPKLILMTGPYRYVRNPQTFGAVFWWCGWALVFNSPGGLVVGVGAIPTVVFWYIRLVEERELARRFGRSYTEYKVGTPFILPTLKRPAALSDGSSQSVAIGQHSGDSP